MYKFEFDNWIMTVSEIVTPPSTTTRQPTERPLLSTVVDISLVDTDRTTQVASSGVSSTTAAGTGSSWTTESGSETATQGNITHVQSKQQVQAGRGLSLAAALGIVAAIAVILIAGGIIIARFVCTRSSDVEVARDSAFIYQDENAIEWSALRN